MDSGKPGRRALRGKRLVTQSRPGIYLFLLLFIPVVLWSQSVGDVNLYLEEDPIVEGTRFYIYIEVPQEFTEDLIIQRPSDTDRMRYYSGPARQTPFTYTEIPEGRIRYRYTYTADEAGYSILGGFVLRTGGRILRMNELLVPITADGGLVPPELEWNLPKEPVYEGETVYISLDMHRAVEIVFPGSLQVNTASDGILEEVTGLGELSEYEFGGELFNRIPLATFLYTPLESGNLVIPSAVVRFNDFPRTAPASGLDVLPLPDGLVLESGAVGTFEIHTSELPEDIVEGEEVLFELSISGEGSLGVLQLPNIEVENGIIEGRDQDADYQPTESGYSGRRIQTYRVRPESPGQMRIVIPNFAWFNPHSAELENSGRRELTVGVSARSASENDSLRFSEMVLPQRSGIMELYPLEISHTWVGLALLAFIPLLIVLIVSLRRAWNRRTLIGFMVFVIITSAAAVYLIVQYDPQPPLRQERAEFFTELSEGTATIAGAQNLLDQRSRDSELLFGLAQLHYGEGNNALAVHLLRQAVSRAPLNTFYRTALDALEGELQLFRQFSISRLLHSDWAFLIAYACILLSGFYLAYTGFAPVWNGVFVVGSVIIIILLVGSIFLYFLYNNTIERDFAVIREGGVMLKKIPDPDAANWIFLPGGTTVDSRVEASGFLQIRTAYGIVAWIPRGGVYIND